MNPNILETTTISFICVQLFRNIAFVNQADIWKKKWLRK